MEPSFWESDVLLEADCIVVGGGIIGLQTALELRAQRPHDRILVLEQGVLPSGASSRNAGFACFGSLTEILSDLDRFGEAAVLGMVEQRWHGLSRLRQRLGDAAIGYEGLGGFDLLRESELAALDRLEQVNHLLHPLFGKPVFSLDAAMLAGSRFGASVKALVRNTCEGQLHTGKLMHALARLAGRNGIEIHTGAKVISVEDSGSRVHVRTAGSPDLVFNASCVAICTNGLTGSLVPDAGIAPARGQVLVTEPIPDLPWRGTYHLDRGFYYFRNIGERVLLGGGRHLDFATEATTASGLTESVQSALEDLLKNTILPGRPFRIAYRWSGLMGFTGDKQPVARLLSPRLAIGFGCNGMGVALGAEIAAQTAALLSPLLPLISPQFPRARMS